MGLTDRLKHLKSVLWRVDANTIYIYAIIVGFLTGLAAILFFLAVHHLSHLIFTEWANWPIGEWEGGFGTHGRSISLTTALIVILVPTIGGLLAGLVNRYMASEAAGSGVDVFLDAFHKQSGVVKKRSAFVKFLSSVATLGSGGSGGKEGPMVFIGASIGSLCGRFLKMGARYQRTLLLAGAAGGLGAIFRAPLGGAIVAVEVLYEEDFETDALIPCIISSVTAYTLFSGILGFAHNLKFQTALFHSPIELVFFVVLSLICSTGGFLFVKIFHGVKRRFDAARKIPLALRPALGGAIIGLIGLMAPQTIGEGLGVIQAGINGAGMNTWAMTALAFLGLSVLKMLTTSVTIESGGSGGALIPSLFMGATIGVAFGTLVHRLFPVVSPDVMPYAIVGMAAFFSSVTNASLGALVMVTELTGGYELLPPLMLVAGISLIISRHWSLYKNQPRNKFASQAHLGDINPVLLKNAHLDDIFRGAYPRQAIVPKDAPLARLEEIASKTGETDYVIVDEKNALTGLLSFRDINISPEEWPSLRSVVVVQDLAIRKPFFVTKSDSLLDVLQVLHQADFDKVPIVERKSERPIVLGYLGDKDVLKYYHSLGMKREPEAEGFAF